MTQDMNFEESLAKLEEIVRQLEEGQLGLSDSLARYEEGVKHLKLCYQSLQFAERKIELLAGLDADGNPITQPFDDAELTVQEKADSRSRRRSKSPAKSAAEKPSSEKAVPEKSSQSTDDDGDVMDSPRRLF